MDRTKERNDLGYIGHSDIESRMYTVHKDILRGLTQFIDYVR